MADKRPLYVLATAAIILLLVFFFMKRGTTRFDWSENYEEESKDPYGIFVIHQMMNDFFPNNNFTTLTQDLNVALPLDADKKSNYVFIGESMFLDSADVEVLVEYVKEGNDAFISSKTIPFDLMFEIYYEECNYAPWDDYYDFVDSSAVFNFLHKDLATNDGTTYDFIFENKKMNYGWHFIDSIYFCEEPFSMIELGTVNGRVNFAKKEYGEGAFYLHTNPVAFTNINLLEDAGVQYASNVFSHLEEGDVYWDQDSRMGIGLGRAFDRSRSGGSRAIASEESLKYILAQPSLAWAWYLAIFTGLFYLFFRAKRTQRIIPVLEQNENTSFEFISTIGRLYFLQNDHKKLCLQKMKLFLSYIRDKYHLPTAQLDEEFQQKLVAKSEVPAPLVQQILSYYKNIDSSAFVSEQTLIDFHLEMDKFYKTCK